MAGADASPAVADDPAPACFPGMASKSAVSRRFVRRTAGELEALLGRDHPHRAVALTDLHCVACTRGP
jgi:hypothetical protein